MVAAIDQPVVVKKIFAHVGLAADPLIKPEETNWLPNESTLRGLAVERDAVGEDLSRPFSGRVPRLSVRGLAWGGGRRPAR